MCNTSSNTTEWRQALDEVLGDTDSFTDELAAACRGVTVRPDAVQRLAADLAAGRTPKGTPPFTAPEFLFVALTDTDPSVVMAAREHLRDWYLALNSERVSALVWDAQDEREEGPIEAWKLHRDAQLDGVSQ